jgi:predicted nucleic acid-binding protein
MIKAFIDTNVVLDALASREPFRAQAEKLFLLAAAEKFQGFVTASSITDIYYLIRKNVSDSMARESLRNLFQLFSVIDISAEDCETALESSIADYEDALAATGAAKAGVNYIITRDKDFLQEIYSIQIILPDLFLEKLSVDSECADRL